MAETVTARAATSGRSRPRARRGESDFACYLEARHEGASESERRGAEGAVAGTWQIGAGDGGEVTGGTQGDPAPSARHRRGSGTACRAADLGECASVSERLLILPNAHPRFKEPATSAWTVGVVRRYQDEIAA